jgi:SSS family solute:Na+ symporter
MPDVPFIIRIWGVFMLTLVAAAVVSRLTGAPEEERTVKLGDIAFATSMLFNTMATLTIGTLIALYVILW